jgi:hypothetical protein
MKTIHNISICFLILSLPVSAAQNDSAGRVKIKYPVRRLTIEPAIGINPMPSSDLLISNLVQWNVKKRLSLLAHTYYSFNDAFLGDVNYIKTNYNYSISQKFGIGTSLYLKNSSHTFSILAGIKYDAFKETLENPEFKKVSASLSSLSPDVGLMYSLKIGKKKYFFSYRMYIPLYPYPFESSDILTIDGNMASISLEFGFGIRLK